MALERCPRCHFVFAPHAIAEHRCMRYMMLGSPDVRRQVWTQLPLAADGPPRFGSLSGRPQCRECGFTFATAAALEAHKCMPQLRLRKGASAPQKPAAPYVSVPSSPDDAALEAMICVANIPPGCTSRQLRDIVVNWTKSVGRVDVPTKWHKRKAGFVHVVGLNIAEAVVINLNCVSWSGTTHQETLQAHIAG
eukprot:4776053-Prymnesium_polylepis.1